MRKVIFKVSSYLMVAAVFAGSGIWIAQTFAGNAATGVLAQTSGGTGTSDLTTALNAKANNSQTVTPATANLTKFSTSATESSVNTWVSNLAAKTNGLIDAYNTIQMTTMQSGKLTANVLRVGSIVQVDVSYSASDSTTRSLTLPTWARPSSGTRTLNGGWQWSGGTGGNSVSVGTNGVIDCSSGSSSNAVFFLKGTFTI